MTIACLNCGSPYPESGAPYRCRQCGGLFDESDPLEWRGSDRRQAGIWRYLDAPERSAVRVSLGEGNTPLLAGEAFGRRIYFKCEYANPTGSFKDRGMAALVSFLVCRGVRDAVEDSSGNAGASFAAYAARAGVRAHVFIPERASGPKRNQIGLYGAELLTVAGPRANSAVAAQRAAEGGGTYASHAHLPHILPGYATCAFEIAEQLGNAPGTIVVPAGQGGLLLGMARGFQALLEGGVIQRVPRLIGAQAAACAALAGLFAGAAGSNLAAEGETVAEGVRVRDPLRAEAVVKVVRDSGGLFVAVAEDLILPGRDALARLGFYVEPTSGLVWQALAETRKELRDPVVLVLTGSGYKVRA
jgi:threonine synthase